MFRRLSFLIVSVTISWGIVHVTMVSIRLARHGVPLFHRAFQSNASPAEAVDPSVASILPALPAPHVGPTQSIFGPTAESPNPAPPRVMLHPRDLMATPLPSAPLIAGNATDSQKVAKEKDEDE